MSEQEPLSAITDLQHIITGFTIGVKDRDNFTSQLLRLIFKADHVNIAKLRLAYPAEVAMVEHYQKTGKIEITYSVKHPPKTLYYIEGYLTAIIERIDSMPRTQIADFLYDIEGFLKEYTGGAKE